MTTGRAMGMRDKKGLKQGEGRRQRKRAEKSKYGKEYGGIHKAKKYRDKERDQESLDELKSPVTQDFNGFRYE